MEQKILMWLLVLFCIGAALLGITALCIIVQGRVQPKKHCPFVLVLGAGDVKPMNERVRSAYRYLLENPDAVAVVTGGGTAAVTEAQYMKEALTALGISPQRIWMEEQSTSTWENLRFSIALIEQRTGIRQTAVGVVSSDYHLFRTRLHGLRQGLSLCLIPAKTQTFTRWFPCFIREIAGIWHFLILGGTYDQHHLC